MYLSRVLTAVFVYAAITAGQNAPVTVQVAPGSGVTVLGAPGQQQPPQGQVTHPGQQKQEPPARVEGRIIDAATGVALKRVNVVIMPAEPRPDSTPYSTTTDTAGRFAMAEITPGRYRMWAERTGYVRQEYGSRGASRMGATMTIAPAQELKDIEFRLQPHAVITGRVTDEDGEPIAHVQVQTMMYRYMQGKRQLMPAGGSSTNDLGEYRVFGLAPGKYYLSATARNTPMMFNTVDRTAGAATQPDTGYASTYYPGTNDPRSAIQVQVASGKPLTSMDIRLVRTRTIRVRGRLTNAGTNPMSRPMIMLMPRDTGFMMFDRNMSTTRGPDGKFEIRGVTPGSYYLIAQVFEGNSRQSARIPIDVGSTDIDNLELTVSPGQELTGIIRIEGQAQVNPSTLRVMLQPVEFSPMMGGSPPGVVKDDATFSMKDVQPDTYRVMVMGAQNQFYVKSVFVGQQEAKDGEFTVTAGTAPALSVVVSTAGGQIGGMVKGENDAPHQGATVVLVPSTEKRHRNDLYKMATTDQYGKFSLSSIAPGDYKLFAWDNVESGQWGDPDFMQVYESKGKSITIRENAKEPADLALVKNESAGETAAR